MPLQPQEVGMTTHEDLRYDVSDQIAEISLARPPVNAFCAARATHRSVAAHAFIEKRSPRE
jgi:hypothetical protein